MLITTDHHFKAIRGHEGGNHINRNDINESAGPLAGREDMPQGYWQYHSGVSRAVIEKIEVG